jgi:3-methyladenine DNA glycosylase AlkC
MAEPLKTFFSAALVRRLAADIVQAEPTFPSRAFIKDASSGLAQMELLERGKHIATALEMHLPPAYPDAIDVLLRSLGPEHTTDELVGAGMAPFVYLPHVFFVAERGLDHFELSMRAQYELTKRFSAEFSMRGYIARDPGRTFAILREWARDDNAHVRRLVSEGTRLRLPWARRVAWLDRHPDHVLALLELLKDDRTTLVRRSVANNLNDLGKVHPRLLVETCASWLKGASAERRALVEHALRSAVKRGEADALRLLGFGREPVVAIEDVRFQPRRIAIGEQVSMSFALKNKARTSQNLLVDVAVHFVKANGKAVPKRFKLKRVALPPRGQVELHKRISLAVHTTRTPRPGTHAVDVVVNGQAFRSGSFEVLAARSPLGARTRRQAPGRLKLEDLFWELAAELQAEDPRVVEGTIMNGRCLRIGKEFLALVDYKGSGLVVKLPKGRVAELIDEGKGEAFAPAGKVFKEWLSVPKPDQRRWRALMREGIAHVGT